MVFLGVAMVLLGVAMVLLVVSMVLLGGFYGVARWLLWFCSLVAMVLLVFAIVLPGVAKLLLGVYFGVAICLVSCFAVARYSEQPITFMRFQSIMQGH